MFGGFILTFKEPSPMNCRSPGMADLKPSSAPSEDKGMILWTTHCSAQVIRHWDTLMHLYHFQYPKTIVLQDLVMNMVMLQMCCDYIQLERQHIKNLPPLLFSLMLPYMQGTVSKVSLTAETALWRSWCPRTFLGREKKR